VDQRHRRSRIALQSTLEIVLLAITATTLPLQAQSHPSLISGLQQPRTGSELRDQSFVPSPEIESNFHPLETSTAPGVEGGHSTALPQTSSLSATDILAEACPATTSCPDLPSDPELSYKSAELQPHLGAKGEPGEDSKSPSVEVLRPPKPPDFNQNIYYRNKLEFGLDVGYLPINIPFVFDVFIGDGYTLTPLRYTLVPIIASVRWQMGDVAGPSFLRGNWDLSASASAVVIPRGPETRYYAWIMGIRRNFVQRNWKIAPYFDGRLGLGNIDAKEPLGVIWSQGQNFTFTMNMGSGVRYNFNPRYSISAGLNWMHISNLYLSEPKFPNYGINVYGPMFGIDVRIGKPHHHASE
jgi:hypothetical protein